MLHHRTMGSRLRGNDGRGFLLHLQVRITQGSYMHISKISIALLALVSALGLAGCAATAPQLGEKTSARIETTGDLKDSYARLAQAGGKTFALNPSTSNIRIFVFSGGSAANLGHAHVLSAPRFTGYFHLPADGARHAQFDLEFALNQLEIDNPHERAALGKSFATPLTADDIARTREHMLGENNLQAEKFPLVRIHSMQISGAAPKFAAKILIELHGVTREMLLPLNVVGLPAHLAVTGSLVLRQSDFGIKPYTVLGGLLAVEDELVIEFQLDGG
jgi:hypothetical protein